MDPQQLTPDANIFWQWHFVKLNATIAYTWLVMGILVIGSWLVTRGLKVDPPISRLQNLLEAVVDMVRTEIAQLSGQQPDKYLTFIGTLFLFIAVCNILSVVPGFFAPTASLSTTAALAACVFVAVPLFGIAQQGLFSYLKQYAKPTLFMLPFNIIGELSRTLALAVRLFGNIMSGAKISAILLAVAPLFFPVVMHALGLLTGLIQAYIFAILAMVYIASATKARAQKEVEETTQSEE
jgi:F-type H+-transporting ATPase subunit a